MPIRKRVTGKEDFEVVSPMPFDDVKRNIGAFVEKVGNGRLSVDIGLSEESLQFLAYDISLAEDNEDDVERLKHLEPVKPSKFAAHTVSYQTILRFTGLPMVIGSRRAKIAFKVHPDWEAKFPIIAEAREKLLESVAEDRLGRIEGTLERMEAMLNKLANVVQHIQDGMI